MADEKKGSEKKSKQPVKKGDKYQCDTCGLIITVSEPCTCVDECDIVCCGQEMQQPS